MKLSKYKLTVPIIQENKPQAIRFRFFKTTRPDNSPQNFISLILNFFSQPERPHSLKAAKKKSQVTRTCVCRVSIRTALAKQPKTQSKLHQEFKLLKVGTGGVQYFTIIMMFREQIAIAYNFPHLYFILLHPSLAIA